jgi:hypothetical protein
VSTSHGNGVPAAQEGIDATDQADVPDTGCCNQSAWVTAGNGLCQSIQSYESPDWAHAQFAEEAGLIASPASFDEELKIKPWLLPHSMSLLWDVLLS